MLFSYTLCQCYTKSIIYSKQWLGDSFKHYNNTVKWVWIKYHPVICEIELFQSPSVIRITPPAMEWTQERIPLPKSNTIITSQHTQGENIWYHKVMFMRKKIRHWQSLEIKCPDMYSKHGHVKEVKSSIEKFLIVLNKKLHGIKAPFPWS